MAELRSIQRLPSGLLEVLGMKGTGFNPNELMGSIRGVIDLRQMYANASLDNFASGPNTGVLPATTVTVPANQHWLLLYGFGLVTTNDATTTMLEGVCELALMSSSAGSGPGLLPVAVNSEHRNTTTLPNGMALSIPFFPPYPVLMGPSSRFQARVSRATGGTSTTVAVQVVVGVFS